jgi:hypothetical protein
MTSTLASLRESDNVNRVDEMLRAKGNDAYRKSPALAFTLQSKERPVMFSAI